MDLFDFHPFDWVCFVILVFFVHVGLSFDWFDRFSLWVRSRLWGLDLGLLCIGLRVHMHLGHLGLLDPSPCLANLGSVAVGYRPNLTSWLCLVVQIFLVRLETTIHAVYLVQALDAKRQRQEREEVAHPRWLHHAFPSIFGQLIFRRTSCRDRIRIIHNARKYSGLRCYFGIHHT